MSRSASPRWFLLAVFLGFTLLAFTPVGGGVASAQDEKPAEPAGKAPDAKPKDSLLWHIIKSAGIIFGPLLLGISIMLVALIVLLTLDLRLGSAVPPAFVEDFTDTVNKRRFKEAFEMTKEEESYLGRVLATGMGRLQYGIEDAREAAFNMVDSIEASKKQFITYLATIGTLGPLLGLVGTVFGMILSFMELGKGGPPDPSKLAEGISHALVVTLLGIALSVPAIFAHAFFSNRLTRIKHDVANMADDLLTQMYHNSKKAGGSSADTGTGTDNRGANIPAIKPR
jgi:biopolymer transport protein ExbB